MKRFSTVAACALCFLAVTACTQESEAPAEQAGGQIEESAQEAGAEVGEATEGQTEEAGGKPGESTQE